MTTITVFLVISAIVAVALLVLQLARIIRGDGYGSVHREPPASHYRDLFDPTRLA